MAIEFYTELQKAYNSNQSFVLCTVIETIGSSPGKVGQKMIVFRNGATVGTIGGGINENRAKETALDLFVTGGSTVLSFDMSNKDLFEGDPVCGGESKVLLELQNSEPRMIIFGAGHIGCLLAKVANLSRFRVTIADERPEFASEAVFPNGIEVICKPYKEAVEAAKIDDNSYIVVATPGHVKDRETIEYVLNSDAVYIGLVGSGKKSANFRASLKERGFDPKKVDALYTPIGISLGSTTPEEIVIEIMAQIVALRNGREIRYNPAQKL